MIDFCYFRKMKASDLRIGNFVKHKQGQEIIEQVDESWLVPEMAHLIEQTYESVPITEEWLLKFGFKAIVGKKLWFTIPMTQGVQLDYDNGTFYLSGHGIHVTFIAGIQEVHTLQNFYFEKTAKELKLVD